MSMHSSESGPVGGGAELLTALQFQEALRQVIRFRPQLPVENPLAAAAKQIAQNPAFSQSRLLTRILDALTHQRGEFRRAEITALDAQTFALVLTLMDAFAAGTYTRAERELAVKTAKAAGLDAGG